MVEAFNTAGALVKSYKEVDPNAESACPHVLLCVIPRQIEAHGDPTRRGSDHSEAYGANVKDSIHRRCNRRKLSEKRETHRRKDGSISHTQRGIKTSRIIQTFRDQSVRERLLRDPESQPFLLRRHHVTAETGFADGGEREAREREQQASIHAKLCEDRKHA